MNKSLNRPKWDIYFLEMAKLASKRSPDSQTKCGCVIVDDKNRLLSQGYNGFPRGVDDEILPNERPEKYPWMIHAEVNAVLNCSIPPRGAKAYITTIPCFNCLLLMWQAGITEVIYAEDGDRPHMIDSLHEELTKRFIELSGMKLIGLKGEKDGKSTD